MIIIIDAYNLIFCGYHAFKGQLRDTTPDTAALYGFFRMLMSRVKANIMYSHIFVVFDHGRSPWRLELLPEYKATRHPDPGDTKAVEKAATRSQVMQAVDALYGMREFAPWHTLRMPETEADDLIGALCHHYEGVPKQVVSSDKDMLQLVALPHTSVWSPVKSMEINPHTWYEAVKVWNGKKTEHFTPTMDNYIFYKAFIGEQGPTSDNIPGVPGWGPLTAARVFCRDGVIGDLHEDPKETLKACGVTTWKSVGQKTLDNPEIFRRNIRLMSLQVAVDRLPDDWTQWIGRPSVPWDQGRDMLWNWLEARQFKSIQKVFNEFDMMATRIRP